MSELVFMMKEGTDEGRHTSHTTINNQTWGRGVKVSTSCLFCVVVLLLPTHRVIPCLNSLAQDCSRDCQGCERSRNRSPVKPSSLQ